MTSPLIIDWEASANGVALDIIDGSLTLDDEWSPAVQLRIRAHLPSAHASIDPRLGHRITLTTTQTVADGSIAPSVGVWELGIRTRVVNRNTGEIHITAESDESLLQDFVKFATVPQTFAAGSLQNLISTVIAAAVPGSTVNLVDVPVAIPIDLPYYWYPGQSAWDVLSGPIAKGGVRLYSLGNKAFRVEPSGTLKPFDFTLDDTDNVTVVEDILTREGVDFANGVVIEYRWTDESVTPKVQKVQYDSFAAVGASKGSRIQYPDTKYPGAGAAQAIQTRMLTRGRNVKVTAISDYDVKTGGICTVLLAGEAEYTSVTRSIEWMYPRGLMSVQTKEL